MGADAETIRPGRKIAAIYAWVAVHRNGGEGIMSHAYSDGLLSIHLPLLSSDLTVAQGLEFLAIQCAAEADGEVVPVLRTFTAA